MAVRSCFAAAVALVVLAGCAGGGKKGAEAPPGTVVVSEKEFTIGVSSQSVTSGQVTFQVKNEGSIDHNFVVFTADRKTKLGELDAIKPGEAKELKLELQSGEYLLVCTVAGHEEAGMRTTLRVQ